MLAHVGAYVGLFISAFFAATVLPAQSEAGLAALILASPTSVTLLIATASVGNVLGSVVNWYIGRGINRISDNRWFLPNKDKLSRATNWYSRYGRWSLLLSWVPIIGDPLTVVAGIMREPLLRFVLFVGIAKAGRYILVALAALQWL